MNHPLALAVVAKYYEYGDFFYEKDNDLFNTFALKAQKIGIEVKAENTSNSQTFKNLTSDEVEILRELFSLHDYKKIKDYLLELDRKYAFLFIKEWEKKEWKSRFIEFNNFIYQQ